MAYGDDLPSPVQRRLAFAAGMLALLELAYSWLVAGMMAAAPNPRLTALSAVLMVILIGNGVLLFGHSKPPHHWLRISSAASLVLMIVGPAVLVLVAVMTDAS